MYRLNIDNILEETIPDMLINKDVMIYGTGTLAKEVYKLLLSKNYKISYFLNNSFEHPNVVSGFKEVKKIDDNTVTHKMKSKSTIIVAAFTTYADMHKIIKELEVLEYKNIITYSELVDIFEGELLEKFYLNSRKEFLKDKILIKKATCLWSDEKSNILYESIVKFRLSKNYRDLIMKDSLKEQYFPKDIENLFEEKSIRFIDCGAFDGDTIKVLVDKFDTIDSVIAFEPDLENYKKLIGNLADMKLKQKIQNISAFPCAIYSTAVQTKFRMESCAGSGISDCGEAIVQCISIDESIGGFKPTYIKMDIEGSEYEALLGAQDTICNEKPNLAISLYHTPKDLYRIPLLIDSWNLGYKFYLRMYGYSGYDLVMYAVK